MKTKFLIVFTMLLMLIAKVSYAEDVVSAEIVCNGRNVSVSGSLPNASQSMAVTIFVDDADDNIIYMNQKTTSESGAFDFGFGTKGDGAKGDGDKRGRTGTKGRTKGDVHYLSTKY